MGAGVAAARGTLVPGTTRFHVSLMTPLQQRFWRREGCCPAVNPAGTAPGRVPGAGWMRPGCCEVQHTAVVPLGVFLVLVIPQTIRRVKLGAQPPNEPKWSLWAV